MRVKLPHHDKTEPFRWIREANGGLSSPNRTLNLDLTSREVLINPAAFLVSQSWVVW